jgi:putative nucleic acid binding protein
MNSLSLLIIAGLLALIALLWIFRKRKIVLFFIVLAVGAAGWYGYKEYFRTNKDLANVKPDIKISAADLIKEYEKNDSVANTKFLGQVIETNGNVKAVEKDDSGYYTIVLADTGSMSSVRCSIDTTHQDDAARLAVGSSAMVRGSCTGFNKDEMGLGSDVILNRCVIVQQKTK